MRGDLNGSKGKDEERLHSRLRVSLKFCIKGRNEGMEYKSYEDGTLRSGRRYRHGDIIEGQSMSVPTERRSL